MSDYNENIEVVDTNIIEEETICYEEPEVTELSKNTSKGAGIASLICGIISLIGCCGAWYVSIPCAIAAIVCGIIQCKKKCGKGMAIAGMICAAIGIIMSIVILIATIAMIRSGVYMELLEQFM